VGGTGVLHGASPHGGGAPSAFRLGHKRPGWSRYGSAAQGTGSIAQSISTISTVSSETGTDAVSAREAAEGLAEITAELSRLVNQFKV
jgi:hypothetical protein